MPGLVLRLWSVLACMVAAGIAHAGDLATLAALDGASGDEQRVIGHLKSGMGGTHSLGANGSLLVAYGTGRPHTLLVTGVDEPGFVVTGLDEEGYLRVRPLAGTRFAGRLEELAQGRHVRVSTRNGKLVNGVIAARAAHFVGSAAYGAGSAGPVIVDVGARSRAEVHGAGIQVLDRVTLAKTVRVLSGKWLAAPWISTRSGAALLWALAGRLRQEAPSGMVTLAFVTQQHPYNSGLARILASLEADRAVLVLPGGSTRTEVGPVAGREDSLAQELLALAPGAGAHVTRSASNRVAFGPFGNHSWPAGVPMATLSPAVRNGATPAAAVELGEMDRLVNLLARLVRLPRAGGPSRVVDAARHGNGRPRQRSVTDDSPLEGVVRSLVSTVGVSGREQAVRDAISAHLPPRPSDSYATRVDDAGNLIVRLGQPGPPSAAFLAHMDEIGFAVRSQRNDGALAVEAIGGSAAGLFLWRAVTVQGPQGTLPGLITRTGIVDLGIDRGSEQRTPEISRGSSVTAPKHYSRLLGTRVAARSLDDRLGCAVLVRAVWRLLRRARRAHGTVEFVFTVEEETGLHGARHYAETRRPARVYPIDTFVTSDSPLETREFAYAPLGAGPVLRAVDESGVTPVTEVRRVEALARRAGLPLQVGVTAGGNDGSAIVGLDTANIPIGFPLRYAHSEVETADMRDAEAMLDLVELLASEELRPR